MSSRCWLARSINSNALPSADSSSDHYARLLCAVLTDTAPMASKPPSDPASSPTIVGAKGMAPENASAEHYADIVRLLSAHRVSVGLSAMPPTQSKKEPKVSARNGLGKMASLKEYQETSDSNSTDVEAGNLQGIMLTSALDPSLVMGMERTLFSAFNQSILLTVSGIGFMSVDEQAEEPTQFGTFLIMAGLFYSMFSFGMHAWRLKRLKAGRGLYEHDSLIWTFVLTLFIFFALYAAGLFSIPYF